MSMATLRFSEHSSGADIASSFGTASAVVIAGVLAAWVFVKQGTDALPEPLEQPQQSLSEPLTTAKPVARSLLEQAEGAFAAGRIIEPEFDNALGHYLALLAAEPDNADAKAGVDRVVAYLENQAEGAIFQNDWDAARAYAAVISNVRPDDAHARSLRERADRFEKIEQLTVKALDQFSRGRLVSPASDNAAASYRAILQLDPANSVAQQGLKSIVLRLVANAQSAAYAGENNRAKSFIAQARKLDPTTAGLNEIEKSTRQIKRVAENRNLQSDLLAAAEALQADRLMPPATPNAFDLFSGVLARDPASDAAQRGLTLVQDALLDRARALIAAGSLDEAGAVVAQAQVAGAKSERIDTLQADLKYQQRLRDAREGRFDRLYSVSELTTTNQVVPTYPRAAAARKIEGWVEVEFTVTPAGEVLDAKVVQSSATMFDDAALSAIARWTFEPVIEDGRPVPVRAALKFTFRG
jgi:periplasmic protein TonB